MTDLTRDRILENIKPFKRGVVKIYSVGVYEGIIRPLLQSGIDRKDRLIRVCYWCGRWWTGKGWQVTNIPVGKQSHTFCQLCCDVEMVEMEGEQRL